MLAGDAPVMTLQRERQKETQRERREADASSRISRFSGDGSVFHMQGEAGGRGIIRRVPHQHHCRLAPYSHASPSRPPAGHHPQVCGALSAPRKRESPTKICQAAGGRGRWPGSCGHYGQSWRSEAPDAGPSDARPCIASHQSGYIP